jgi:hypothetical protein
MDNKKLFNYLLKGGIAVIIIGSLQFILPLLIILAVICIPIGIIIVKIINNPTSKPVRRWDSEQGECDINVLDNKYGYDYENYNTVDERNHEWQENIINKEEQEKKEFRDKEIKRLRQRQIELDYLKEKGIKEEKEHKWREEGNENYLKKDLKKKKRKRLFVKPGTVYY